MMSISTPRRRAATRLPTVSSDGTKYGVTMRMCCRAASASASCSTAMALKEYDADDITTCTGMLPAAAARVSGVSIGMASNSVSIQLVERGAQRTHAGAAAGEVRFAPMVRAVAIALPLGGNADAAGEGDLAVHHQHLAVGTVDHLIQAKTRHRPEPARLHAGVRHLAHQLARHRQRADTVQQDAHFHAGARPLHQRLDKVDRHLAGPVDVRQQLDAVPRPGNRCQHRRKDAHTVDVGNDLVALGERHAQRAFERDL